MRTSKLRARSITNFWIRRKERWDIGLGVLEKCVEEGGKWMSEIKGVIWITGACKG